MNGERHLGVNVVACADMNATHVTLNREKLEDAERAEEKRRGEWREESDIICFDLARLARLICRNSDRETTAFRN